MRISVETESPLNVWQNGKRSWDDPVMWLARDQVPYGVLCKTRIDRNPPTRRHDTSGPSRVERERERDPRVPRRKRSVANRASRLQARSGSGATARRARERAPGARHGHVGQALAHVSNPGRVWLGRRRKGPLEGRRARARQRGDPNCSRPRTRRIPRSCGSSPGAAHASQLGVVGYESGDVIAWDLARMRPRHRVGVSFSLECTKNTTHKIMRRRRVRSSAVRARGVLFRFQRARKTIECDALSPLLAAPRPSRAP